MAEKEEVTENNNTIHTAREYQVQLLESAMKRNIIVCLGTGTGKTFISIKLIEHLARKDDIYKPFSNGGKRTFFLVNSVPLVFQQATAIRRHTNLRVGHFCGEMGVDFWTKQDWVEHFEDNEVLVMTHQIYFDLLQHAKLRGNQANLLILDECHHAKKNHPFKRIMDLIADPQFNPEKYWPRILGLTASVVGQKVKPCQIPGKIRELERTMRCRCETAQDPDVVEKYGAKPREVFETFSSSKHTHPVAVYIENEIRSALGSLSRYLDDVKIVQQPDGSEEVLQREVTVSKGAMRECSSALDSIGVWAAYEVSKLLIDDFGKRIAKVRASLSSRSNVACLFLEATLTALRKVCGIYDEFASANEFMLDEIPKEFLKPKVIKLLELFEEPQDNICSIVFVQRRYAACVVSRLIDQVSEVTSNFVTGHGLDLTGISETDMKYNKQQDILKDFRAGKFNVLVGTSVVEEGVDIPKCNLVVMFDFPNNYRAYVQSRGRGRARDAKYVLLVERSTYAEQKQEQEMYQEVDKFLTALCRENRSLPSEDDCLEEVNIDPLPSHYTDINAKVDMGSAVGLIYRYCSMLPCDRFTTLKPKFTFEDLGKEFRCTLQMPRNCPIRQLITGEAMGSKHDAKRAVALKACKVLHAEFNELNDNLLPKKDISDSESSDVDETDGTKPKTGTKKRRRSYKIKVIDHLNEPLLSGPEDKVYVYAIKMKVENVYISEKAKVKKKLWDRKHHLFGLVTKNELPRESLETFSLYHSFGEVSIQMGLCETSCGIEAQHLGLFDWFHNFIFADVLRYGAVDRIVPGSRVVLLSIIEQPLSPLSNKRPYSPEIIGIDYDEMKAVKKKAENWSRKVPPLIDITECVLVPEYRCDQVPTYLVIDVDRDLTPLSEFPDPLIARTYKTYYEKKYGLDIRDDTQPLLNVIPFTKIIDCRSNRPSSSSSERFDKERLVPELCTFLKYSQSLLLRACLLPSLCYRLQSRLGVYELRSTIEEEVAGAFTFRPVTNGNSLAKKFRHIEMSDDLGCSSGEMSSGDVSSDNVSSDDVSSDDVSSDDVVDMPDGVPNNVPSTLDKYFCANSSPVPMFALLESLTCACSDDNFDLERLEMLGDSFLKMAVSVYVYWHQSLKDEGRLTKHRIKQISNKNLFNLAVEKQIPSYIKYSKFNRKTWHPPGFNPVDTQVIPDKSVADSVEAMIGAHLTHCGYMTTLKFMEWLGLKVLEENTPNDLTTSRYANYPRPTFEIPMDEDNARYQSVLKEQITGMKNFEKTIGYTFKNKVLLLEAFTHPTFTDHTITGSYQRLEFLGDAILDFLVTQHIYNQSGEKLTPGKLSELRSALVNNNIFATIAVKYDYHKYLKQYSPELFNNIGAFVVSCEELGDEVNHNPYVIPVLHEETGIECFEAPKPLGDVFESVAGAVFLDSGLDLQAVWRVYYQMLQKYINAYSQDVPLNPVQAVFHFDNKLKFGHAQTKDDGRISCDLMFSDKKAEEIGQKVFTGEGRNKHNAKLCAAYIALQKINKIPS